MKGNPISAEERAALPLGFRRGFGWFMLLLLPLAVFLAVDLINGTRVLHFTPRRAFANYLCYLMLFALAYGISRSAWITVLAAGGGALAFGIVNYYVVEFRGEPVLPWDMSFGSLRTALGVAGGYRLEPSLPILLSLLGLAAAVLLCFFFGREGKEECSRRFRLGERAFGLAVAVVLAFLIFPANLLSSLGISVWAWNQKTSGEYLGVTANFFANVQFLMVEKPEDYSPEAAELIGERVLSENSLPASAEIPPKEETSPPEEEAPPSEGTVPVGIEPGQRPTVIVVMNESFTDLQNAGDLELDQDAMPFLHSLMVDSPGENTAWGGAYASVFGGNTCNSEFEFLTGNSMVFLPVSSKPYQQYIKEPQTALPGILKSQGYRCTAIHPGLPSAWQREEVYPLLGFDKAIFAPDFTVQRRAEHRLTADSSTYDQIIAEYERRDPDVPQFFFDVTIQNHGGYDQEDYPATVHIRTVGGENAAGSYPDAEQYLSLVRRSDEDIQALVNYFSRQEEPVILLFFGDHWPGLDEEFYARLLGAGEELELPQLMQEHRVPFVIWANYPLGEQAGERGGVSMNQLSGILLEAAGLSGTAYTEFLKELGKELPVVTAIGAMDSDGALYRLDKRYPYPYEGLLHDYAILQYNNLFGGEEKAEWIFAEVRN